MFYLYGFVIMPNHCHFLIRVPKPGSISMIMNRYKTCVAGNIGLGPIWQKRFHIRLVDDGVEALQYIHLNPVRAGIVDAPEQYLWSSASGRWDIADLDFI